MTDVTDEELLKALDRIARTRDGELLYLYFQRVTLEILKELNPSDGALRAHHGRRSLAAELMARMGRGIDESGGSTDSTGSGPRERPVVFRRAEPVAVSRHASTRERLAAGDPELAGFRQPRPGDD